MKKAEAKEYKTQLLALRSRLRGDVTPTRRRSLEEEPAPKPMAAFLACQSTWPTWEATISSRNLR